MIQRIFIIAHLALLATTLPLPQQETPVEETSLDPLSKDERPIYILRPNGELIPLQNSSNPDQRPVYLVRPNGELINLRDPEQNNTNPNERPVYLKRPNGELIDLRDPTKIIDPDKRPVYVLRPNGEMINLRDPTQVTDPNKRPVYLLRPNGQLIQLQGPASSNTKYSFESSFPGFSGLPIPLAPPPAEIIKPFLNQMYPGLILDDFPPDREDSTSKPVPTESAAPVTNASDMPLDISANVPMISTKNLAEIPTPDNSNNPTAKSSGITTAPDYTPNRLAGTNSPIIIPSISVHASSNTASRQISPPPHASKIANLPAKAKNETNRDYSFHYSVDDPATGDVKSQWEQRVDGVVTGYYTLIDSDGTLRKVNYTADAHGFRATVSHLPSPLNRTKRQGFSTNDDNSDDKPKDAGDDASENDPADGALLADNNNNDQDYVLNDDNLANYDPNIDHTNT